MKATLLVIMALAWGLAVTADVYAHPDDHNPNLDLNQTKAVWEATFFLDEDPDHILLGTMRVCFAFATVVGTHRVYEWHNYEGLEGEARQEADHVNMTGAGGQISSLNMKGAFSSGWSIYSGRTQTSLLEGAGHAAYMYQPKLGQTRFMNIHWKLLDPGGC
jgi:hypothetical protein